MINDENIKFLRKICENVKCLRLRHENLECLRISDRKLKYIMINVCTALVQRNIMLRTGYQFVNKLLVNKGLLY
jgi:hypothetical protein